CLSQPLTMPPPTQFDSLILGAGAAGLFCAAQAAQRGRRVALLDHGPLPGRKILISGGGRSNFTNLHCAPDRFLSRNPHFAKSALASYTQHHFLELVRSHHIPYHEKTLGQLFCDHSAHAILNMLLSECERGPSAVTHLPNARDITVEHAAGEFRLHCALGHFAAPTLVVATGGLSIPKLGATSFGYALAQQFGLAIVEPRPALVPFTLDGAESSWTRLSGLSATVRASISGQKTSFVEKLLVTHRGLSGPAILQISSYWKPGDAIEIDFVPTLAKGAQILAPLLTGRRDQPSFLSALRAHLPQRLADHLADVAAPTRWTNPALVAAEQGLRCFPFHPSGTEGYAKAEVTAGGVDTAGLNSRTLESRSIPGLFFIGEVVDVTGWLGGYNFQWAWSSAAAAARAL
ncbi:MAG TPA: aminoacetone oxidase family FAD-binding enzyme, partial [Acidobacteriaceae bacterium]|nr:aminoacetone oxidase family FAD-binding enzyme [Acidobacteriaceae bacterium]